MKRVLLFLFFLGAHGLVLAGQTCTFVGDGMGGGQMFCNDPEAELAKTLQLIQQLQQLKAQRLKAQHLQQEQQQRVQAAATQQPTQPALTDEQVKAFTDCSDQIRKSPEAARFLKIFGEANGYHVPKKRRDLYGTEADETAVMQLELRQEQCSALMPLSEDDDTKKMHEIYMLFGAGLRTYGETALALRAQVEKLVREAAQVQ